jgi:hypothetical protein
MDFKITSKEIFLALVIASMGFLFSSREWILQLNALNPVQGLLVYYAILYISLYFLSKAGLIIYDLKIENAVQVFGLLLITFAFFITVDWESQWVQYVTKQNVEQASTVFYESEDGAIMYLWSQVYPMKPENMENLRLLTYVLTPFLLTLVGVFLVTKVEFI